ncbi:hypothetical protein [Paraburkholderia sp. JHI869]|uniref:hypothetical protein n=1 Tax=Paraburkholderia sp. JHI869 TaxID=3112959 RepID=UPI00316BA21C
MTTFDPERTARHRELLASANFKRVSYFMCDEARRALAAQRRRGESLSQALNRLLLEQSSGRDENPGDAREFARRVRQAQNQIRHSQRPANRNGPYITRSWVLRSDGSGSGAYVTADDVQEFDKDSRPP